MAEAKKRWMCMACECTHSTESQAEKCCDPEVEEVWECSECGVPWDTEKEATTCCDTSTNLPTQCPECMRQYDDYGDLNRTAIAVAGHCQTCNPNFTYEQQHQIEGLHHHKTGNWERVNA